MTKYGFLYAMNFEWFWMILKFTFGRPFTWIGNNKDQIEFTVAYLGDT